MIENKADNKKEISQMEVAKKAVTEHIVSGYGLHHLNKNQLS